MHAVEHRFELTERWEVWCAALKAQYDFDYVGVDRLVRKVRLHLVLRRRREELAERVQVLCCDSLCVDVEVKYREVVLDTSQPVLKRNALATILDCVQLKERRPEPHLEHWERAQAVRVCEEGRDHTEASRR